MRNSTAGSPSHAWRTSTNFLGLGAGLLAGAFFLLRAQPPASPVLAAMNDELVRTQAKLKSQPVPPYYLSYEITETHSIGVTGEFGRLQRSGDYRRRQLDIDLRVGDYTLDNTREVRGDMNYPQYSTTVIPIDNDPDAIRAMIWHQTDASYKRALDQLTKVKTNVEVKVAQDDKSADFSREAPEHYSEPVVDVKSIFSSKDEPERGLS